MVWGGGRGRGRGLKRLWRDESWEGGWGGVVVEEEEVVEDETLALSFLSP